VYSANVVTAKETFQSHFATFLPVIECGKFINIKHLSDDQGLMRNGLAMDCRSLLRVCLVHLGTLLEI
jgi:hypothetical protein